MPQFSLSEKFAKEALACSWGSIAPGRKTTQRNTGGAANVGVAFLRSPKHALKIRSLCLMLDAADGPFALRGKGPSSFNGVLICPNWRSTRSMSGEQISSKAGFKFETRHGRRTKGAEVVRGRERTEGADKLLGEKRHPP